MEGGLDAQVIYDPPNLTYPYGAYIAVVDIDPDTAQVTVRRFIAVDDCGVRINPMIVDGQIHGGLAEGVGIALMELISFDEEGNCLNSSFMDYLIPTALECPDFELGETVTPCPHHPLGAKGVGESPNVGSPPAIVNAVIDALHETHGVDHIDMPCTPARVWAAMQGRARAAAMMTAAHVAAGAGARRRRASPFVTATVVRAQRPTSVAGRETSRSCSPTARSRASSAASAPSTACAPTRCRRSQSGEAVLLRILPVRRARTARRRRASRCRRRGDRAEPVPVGRRDRGVPRAGAARAARARRRRHADRRRGPAARRRARARRGRASTATSSSRGRRPRAGRRRARARRAARAAPRASRPGCPTSASSPARSAATGVLGELRGDGVPRSCSRASTCPPGSTSARARRPRSRSRSWRRIVAVRRDGRRRPPAARRRRRASPADSRSTRSAG